MGHATTEHWKAAGKAVEIGHDQVCLPDQRARGSAGPLTLGAGEPVIDIRPVPGHAEGSRGVALSGEVSASVEILWPNGDQSILHGRSAIAAAPARLCPVIHSIVIHARQLGWGRVTNAEALRVLVRRLVTDEELSAGIIADLRREGAR